MVERTPIKGAPAICTHCHIPSDTTSLLVIAKHLCCIGNRIYNPLHLGDWPCMYFKYIIYTAAWGIPANRMHIHAAIIGGISYSKPIAS